MYKKYLDAVSSYPCPLYGKLRLWNVMLPVIPSHVNKSSSPLLSLAAWSLSYHWSCVLLIQLQGQLCNDDRFVAFTNWNVSLNETISVLRDLHINIRMHLCKICKLFLPWNSPKTIFRPKLKLKEHLQVFTAFKWNFSTKFPYRMLTIYTSTVDKWGSSKMYKIAN